MRHISISTAPSCDVFMQLAHCCPQVAVDSIYMFPFMFIFNSSGPSDAPPLEKKYKPLNTPSNSAKEIKVKIIPAQRTI